MQLQSGFIWQEINCKIDGIKKNSSRDPRYSSHPSSS